MGWAARRRWRRELSGWKGEDKEKLWQTGGLCVLDFPYSHMGSKLIIQFNDAIWLSDQYTNVMVSWWTSLLQHKRCMKVQWHIHVQPNLSLRPPALRDCPFRAPKVHFSLQITCVKETTCLNETTLLGSLEWSHKTGLTLCTCLPLDHDLNKSRKSIISKSKR